MAFIRFLPLFSLWGPVSWGKEGKESLQTALLVFFSHSYLNNPHLLNEAGKVRLIRIAVLLNQFLGQTNFCSGYGEKSSEGAASRPLRIASFCLP